MKRHSKDASAIVGLGLWLLALFCPAPAMAAEPIRVAVVLSHDSAIYTGVVRGIAAALEREGRNDISLEVGTLADSAPERPSNVELQVPVGTRATRAMLDQGGVVPLLSVLIPQSAFDELRRASAVDGRNLSAVYLDQPAERQLALGEALLPAAERIGVLLGEKQKPLQEPLGASARRNGAALIAEVIGGDASPATALNRLTREADLIIALSDPAVLTPTTAKRLLYMAYQRRIPVLGFSRTYVDAGALAAVYSTPEQIGRQAAERIISWARSRRSGLGAPEFPRYFNVAVNQPVARSLGFQAPDPEALAETLRESQ